MSSQKASKLEKLHQFAAKGKSVSFNGPLKTQLSSKSCDNLARAKNPEGLLPDNSQRQLQQNSYLRPSDVSQNVQTRSRSSSMSSVDIISEPSSPSITPTISITYSNDNQTYFSKPIVKNIDISHVPQSDFSSPNSPLSSPKIIPSDSSSRQFSSPTPPPSSHKIIPSNPPSRQFSSPIPPQSSQNVPPFNPSYRQTSSPTPPPSSPRIAPSNPSYRQPSSPTPPPSSPRIAPSNPSYRQVSSPTPPPSSPRIAPSNPSARQFNSNSPLSSPKIIPSNNSSTRQFSSSPLSSPKVISSNPSARQFSSPTPPLTSPKIVPSSPSARQFSSPTPPLSSPKVVPQILVDDGELEGRHKRHPLKKNYTSKDDFDDDDSLLYNSNNNSLIDITRPMAPFMYENGNDSGTNDSEDISSDEDELETKSLKNMDPKKNTDSTRKDKVLAIDDYGFVHHVADHEIPEGANGIQRIVQVPGVEEKTARSIRSYRDREAKWVSFLGSMDPSMARDSRKIKKLVRLGIPESVRGKAWQFMAGVHKYRKKGVFDKLRDKEKLPIYDDIEKDIDRCYPDHIHFREKGFGQEDLFNILKAYAHYDTVVGYCQGMGRLVGMMLMQMPAEDTFWLLVATIEEYMGEILEFLGSIPHELLTPDLLLDAAFKIKLKRSTIKRLNKKATEKNSGESDKKLKIDGIEFKLIGDN
ncbi:4776_t:CDS:2, partial [Racocetra fulgida]